jgi:hypothetical protein
MVEVVIIPYRGGISKESQGISRKNTGEIEGQKTGDAQASRIKLNNQLRFNGYVSMGMFQWAHFNGYASTVTYKSIVISELTSRSSTISGSIPSSVLYKKQLAVLAS